MTVRILHCSKSLENYHLCLTEKVSGFVNRGPQTGDIVYLVVKVGKKSLCGARFTLDEPTDFKPWADSERYVNALTIKDIEYCNPFDISILSKAGGNYWAIKYVQGAKPINDTKAIQILNSEFIKNKTDKLVPFEIPTTTIEPEELEEETTIEDDKELEKLIIVIPNAKVTIMGTFQTVQFSNETDKIKGLETLVAENFTYT